MLVNFLPSGIKQFAQKGDNLFEIAAKANVMIDGNCGSKGICGKCKVQVVTGKTPAPDALEALALTDKEIAEGYRLACRLTIEDDLTVVVPEINSAKLRKTKLIFMPRDFTPTNHIKKHYVEVKPFSLENPKSDLERIFAALPGEGYTIEPSLLIDIPKIFAQSQNMTVVEREKRIIALEAGDTRNYCYGLAFDIGTTTVVGMLWDLNKGELAGVSARTNPQSSFGADVISRIHYSGADPGNLLVMKTKIRDCFNEMIKEFTENYDLECHEIYDVTVVGNTTMSHLFLGVNPEQLARAPFAPVFCLPVDVTGKEMGLEVNPQANIHLLPNIAGHVGSDITGVLLATRIMELDGLNLAVDVGTNGEIVLAKGGRALACSTAAGPAFEGAAIYQGMRAAAGAIEGVQIENGEVALEVIDDQKPVGICGSGLIDAVAELLNAGIIDQSGRLLNPKAATGKGIHPSLTARLREGQNGREFVLAWGEDTEDIVVTQKDIREVQLAKGAIYAGIVIMLNELGAKMEDLDRIILAGAFGNYIKKESALRIGLFPNIPASRIISAGNAAGTGASMALLSIDERKKAYAQARMVEHVELAGRSDFQTEFMKAMYFTVG